MDPEARETFGTGRASWMHHILTLL